jgi:Tol biopolymer transport system component
VADDVAQASANAYPIGYVAALSTSDAGRTLLYGAGTNTVRTKLAWFARSGASLGTLAADAAFKDVAISPDGTRAATTVAGANTDIWTWDMARAVRSRLTFGPDSNESGVWSPEGKQIAYGMFPNTGSPRLVARRADATGEPTILADDPSDKYPLDWSDGRFLLYQRQQLPAQTSNHAEVWIYSFADQKTYPFLRGPFEVGSAKLSPDGRFVAFRSAESGRFEVYVTTFPTPGEKIRISTDGGNWPLWRHDGRELFYIAADGTVTAVTVTPRDRTLALDVPKPLFKTSTNLFADQPYAVTPDGQRFLVNTGMIAGQITPLTLVTNWTGLVEQR